MRFLLIFTKKSVAEWRQCYYDYLNVKSLIILCKKAYAIKCNIEDLAREDNYSTQQNSLIVQNRDALQLVKSTKFKQIQQIVQQANVLFYKYHSINKRVVFIFLLYKIHQLNGKIDLYSVWQQYADKTKHLITKLLSNCYAENLKLSVMTQLHLQAYQKIHKKHSKSYKLFGLTSPVQKTARLARNLQSFQRFNDKINVIIDSHQQIVYRQNKFRLQQQVEPSPFKVSMMSYLFGLCNGFSICVFIAAIVLLAVNLGIQTSDQQARLKKQTIFLNQFRLWKSTGFIIMYMWVFAISFYIFQTKHINYNLIFGYNSSEKKSTSSLGGATFATLLWCCFFIFYVMDLLQIYRVARVSSNPDYPITIFFPIIIFGLFIVNIIIQFIMTRRGTLFFLMTLAKIIITLFGFYQIAFSVIWATEQIMSLAQIFFDLAYSFCYYSLILQTPDTLNNSCFNLKIIPQIVTIVAYAIRFFQSIRLGWQNRQFVGTRQMYRLIRATIYITVAGLSLGSTPGKYNILWFWGFLGVIASIYGFLIDVFLDWNLFYIDNKNRFRRQENIFSIRILNFMTAFNLLARFSFVISFSPNIIFTYVKNPQVIITIACAIQLGRRLAWNLLKVQNEQIKNNFFFRIRTDYQRKQRAVLQQVSKKNPRLLKKNILNQKRDFEQLKLLRAYINQKNQLKEKVIQFCESSNKILQNIEDTAEDQIFKLVGSIN